MLLGLAKGKVGDLVFYRDGGEQRTRTRVIPKNPRSIAQMTQRAKMANVSALYRNFASILRGSFSNRPSNQSGYNAFVKHAISYAPYQTKEMAANNVVLPQRAFASMGTLPTLDTQYNSTEEQENFGVAIAGGVNSSSTMGAISQQLIKQYGGLENGDKLTFVRGIFVPVEDSAADVDIYDVQVSTQDFILDVDSTQTGQYSPVAYVYGGLGVQAFATPSADTIRMDAVIVSRVDSNGILRTSTQFFELNAPAQALYEGYRTPAAINDAVESYRASNNSILR